MSGFRRALASFCLTILRMALCVWVGAAALFVITSIAEQTSPEFGSQIRDQLATIRFPLYYQFGFAALGTALASGCLAVCLYQGPQRRRILVAVAFAVLSLVGAAIDYQWVYRPLQSLIVPPGQARNQQFMALHQRSRHINEVHITLALIAALVACAPAHTTGDSSRSRQRAG